MRRLCLVGMVLALVGGAVLWPYVAGAAKEDSSRVILTVNGNSVYQDELDKAINTFVPASSFHGGVTPEVRERYKSKAIDLLVDRELLYREALKVGIRPDRKKIETEIDETRKAYGSKKNFQEALEREGLTLEAFRLRLEKEMLIEAFTSQEIGKPSQYTEDELKAHYDRNQESFRRPPSIYVWHIILKVPPNAKSAERNEKKKMADQVAERAKKGEDFTMLAEKFSEDDYRVVGGKLGLVHEGQLAPALQRAAFSMKEGEITGPIETIYGFHILKAGQKVEAGIVSYDTVRESLKESLEKKKAEELKSKLLNRLKVGVNIRIHE